MQAMCNINLKYNVKLRYLPIGGLICLSSSTMFSDKIIALKQDNATLVVISDRVFCRSVSYVALECVHYLHFKNKYLPLHVSTEAPTLSTSILLDYTSYSQTEWRYVRYKLGEAAVYPIVMHSDIFESVVRHLSMFDLRGLKSTFLMFLQFCVSDISFHVFRRQLSTFLRLIVRSRTVLNTYTIDRLSHIDDIEENDIIDVESEHAYLSEIDDDEEYKASIIASEISNLSLVQQLSTAGVLIQNQVYSLVNISMFFNFSYMQFYAMLHVFFYLFIMSLLFNIVYFIHYVWTVLQHSIRLLCKYTIDTSTQLHYYY